MPGLESNRARCLKKHTHMKQEKLERKAAYAGERKDCFVSAYSADELRLKYIRQRDIF